MAPSTTSSHELDLSSPGDPGVQKEQEVLGRGLNQGGPLPIKVGHGRSSPGMEDHDPLVFRPKGLQDVDVRYLG